MKIKFFTSALVIYFATIFNGSVFAQTVNNSVDNSNTVIIANASDAEKVKNIKKLLEVTGAGAMAKQIVTQMVDQMKSEYPNMPSQFWDTFVAEYNAEEMINRMIPVYSKYYTNEEIKGIIAFYQTPLGKKTIRVMPQLMTESTQIGNQYGQEIARRAMNKLRPE